LILCVSALVSIFTAAYAWHHRETAGAGVFVLLMSAFAIWSEGETLDLPSHAVAGANLIPWDCNCASFLVHVCSRVFRKFRLFQKLPGILYRLNLSYAYSLFAIGIALIIRMFKTASRQFSRIIGIIIVCAVVPILESLSIVLVKGVVLLGNSRYIDIF